MIDTHAHLNFSAFKDDADTVLKRCLDNDVWMINVGTQLNTSKRAVSLAEKYKEGVYAAVGLHPIHVKDGFSKDDYRKLALSEKVVAIGETGLDKLEQYAKDFEKQKEVFKEQISLADELNLPLIIHCRKAHNELIEIIKDYKIKGVIHCFTGNWNQAKQYLDMGLYIGFNGIIFNLNLDSIIEKVPEDKILIETDCPYLTPPMADAERNEPIYVKYVAEKISKIKGLNVKDLINVTTENAKKLFKI